MSNDAGGNNANSNHNGKTLGGPSLERRQQEFQLKNRFFYALEKRIPLYALFLTLEEVDKQQLPELNRNVMAQGLAVGILSLAALRKGRANRLNSMILRRDEARVAKKGVEGKGSSMSESELLKLEKIIRQNQDGYHFRYIFGWFVDISLFSFVVTSYNVLLTDTGDVPPKFGRLPLKPGRSTVCEEVCPIFVRELKKIRKELSNATTNQPESNNIFDADCLKNPQDAVLKNILLFTKNCKKRAAYKKHLRAEQELKDGKPILIPPPGVPVNFKLTKKKKMTVEDASDKTWKDVFIFWKRS